MVEVSAYRFKTRGFSFEQSRTGWGFRAQLGKLYLIVWFG